MIIRNPPAGVSLPQPGGQRRAWLVVAALLAAPVLVAVAIPLGRGLGNVAGDGPDPLPVVDKFLAAITAKDVDAALGLVYGGGVGVPHGQEGRFLHPAAVDTGWRLLHARRLPPESRFEARVQVTIGDDQGRASGVLDLVNDDGRWWLSDPFIAVDIVAAPLEYLQVNGRRLLLAHRYDQRELARVYRLLPGRYQFFGRLPGGSRPAPPRLLLPPAENTADPLPVRVPRLQLDTTRAAVQERVNALLDECATARVRAPAGCPFAAGQVVGEREANGEVWLSDIRWTILDYPVVEVRDSGGDRAREGGLAVRWADPGRLRFTATGQSPPPARVAVDCTVGPGLRVRFGPEGPAVEYRPGPGEQAVTCPPGQEPS